MVFDVGANVGQMALPILVSGIPELVVLIDANPQALAQAAENVFRNGLWARTRFVCAFASDRGGTTVRFWTVGTGQAGSFLPEHAATASRTGSSSEVSTVTLDEVCSWVGCCPDFVKVDVEGAEWMVLEGARDLAAGRRARFLVEMHSCPALSMKENAERVLRWCQEVGYGAWYLAQTEELTSAEQIAHRGRCHLLLQPVEWEYPEWLKGVRQGAQLDFAVSPTRRKEAEH
ncbi:MAG: FkbM family methyltransferase [Armatimonadota bacterium]